MLKASALKDVLPPSGRALWVLFRGNHGEEIAHGWVAGFRRCFGAVGVSHSTESLILAQDERWRRA